jgi:predicted nucleotidyltransferase
MRYLVLSLAAPCSSDSLSELRFTLPDLFMVPAPSAVSATLSCFPAGVQRYLADLVQACSLAGHPLVSIVVFGSAAKGGFTMAASDVDLLLVVADDSPQAVRRQLQALVQELETAHGFRTPAAADGLLNAFLDKAGGNALSCFVCTRSDLLSGEVARVLSLPGPTAALVGRIVLASILAPAITAWGEELLAQVSLPSIRRVDVFLACFNFVNLLLLTAAAYPWLSAPTKHAVGTLKRAVHSCYFCYCGQAAPLEEEVAFFDRQLGGSRTLAQLLELRSHYHESFGFVLRCLASLLRLHWHTAKINAFPLPVKLKAPYPDGA